MKKVFAIALIAVSFAACNNSGDKKSDNKDTVKVEDTTTIAPSNDTTIVVPGDTTGMTKDTTHK
jgi:hypothetical protein